MKHFKESVMSDEIAIKILKTQQKTLEVLKSQWKSLKNVKNY